MIVLDWLDREGKHRPRQITLLFGLGLIGSAALAALLARAPARRQPFPFDWQQDRNWQDQTSAIQSAVGRLAGAPGLGVRIDVIWSAGNAGFGSSVEDLAREQRAFEQVVELSRRLGRLSDSLGFHFLSSAGGLFEGQTIVDAASAPAPLRPYGRAKLNQEACLTALLPSIDTFIYRATSVYGFAGARARQGLVAALVQNAIRYRTTRITARSDTIRDYVFADDVGSFIADQVAGPRLHAVRTFILASGKPTSMMELVAIVQGTLQRQLFFQYEARPSNARDISVRPSALPRTWQPTPLAMGVYRTAERVMSAYRATTG